MRKEPDEIEFDILKNAVADPGCKVRDCYRDMIGHPHKETFLWTRVQVLIREEYLERREVGPKQARIFPTKKAIKLVRGNGLQNGGASK